MRVVNELPIAETPSGPVWMTPNGRPPEAWGVESNPSPETAQLPAGWRQSRTRWPDAELGPWLVTLSWRLIAGRFECVGVELLSTLLEPTPVQTDVWRAVPIGGFIQDARAKHAAWYERFDQDDRAVEQTKRWGRGRRPRHDPAKVARIYTEALRAGQPPTKTVAETLVISRSSAANQVARARALGLLPPTERGRPRGIGQAETEED